MKIVILSGAGLSAESGLGTFRDEGGLWAQYRIEDVATPSAYMRDPELVHRFYRMRREECVKAQPNAAHFALADLQKSAHEITLITQNVDDLLERAGATDVIHMHGELMRALCSQCDHRWDPPIDMDGHTQCPACGALARPDVVWFGEMPYQMDRCEEAIAACDLFVSIGTSAEVYPAAGFVDIARRRLVDTLEINLQPSARSEDFSRVIRDKASVAVPQWVSQLTPQV